MLWSLQLAKRKMNKKKEEAVCFLFFILKILSLEE
jgi:hypothetical protein